MCSSLENAWSSAPILNYIEEKRGIQTVTFSNENSPCVQCVAAAVGISLIRVPTLPLYFLLHACGGWLVGGGTFFTYQAFIFFVINEAFSLEVERQ